MVAPPVFAALGAVVSFVPMGPLGLFISSVWKKSRDALKLQKAMIDSIERGTFLAMSEVAKIKVLVNQFEEVMKSMEKSLLKLEVGEVEKDIVTYKNVISVLRHEGQRCDEDARLSLDIARDRIIKCLCE